MQLAGAFAVSGKAVGIKRFYDAVTIAPYENLVAILLDGKMTWTQHKRPLLAPTEKLADAVAAEWRAQKEFIMRSTMPLTGMLSATIDGGEVFTEECRDDIVKYARSDLVCYRAQEPVALAQRQALVWDPYIDFMRMEFGAMLVTTAGITAVTQPDAAIAAIRHALDRELPEALCALRIATAISGSAALALTLCKRPHEAAVIFGASRVDERFQEERWGSDEEALAREAGLRSDFLAAARFLSLL